MRRREEVHGLSLLAINFVNQEQLRDFGEKVIAFVVSESPNPDEQGIQQHCQAERRQP